MNIIYRKANSLDANGIHHAHMKSINEICARDYSSEAIKAWGSIPFNQDKWNHAINNKEVYVVIIDDNIEGYIHFEINIEKLECYLFGLYLSPKAKGQMIGTGLIQKMFSMTNNAGVKVIRLDSTLTAQNFYLRHGFINSAPMQQININSQPIKSIPMIQSTDIDEVIKNEKLLHRPEIRSNKSELLKYISNDFYEFGASGNSWDLGSILTSLSNDHDATMIESFDFCCRHISSSSIHITYKCKKDGKLSLRSSLWKKTDTEWQIIFHQGTYSAEKSS